MWKWCFMKKKINQFCSNQSQKCFFLKQSSCLMLYYNLFAYHLPSKVKVKSLSRVRLFATLWTVAYQAPQSMEFSRQEYWSGLIFLSPGDLPNPGIKPRSPALQADALPSEPSGKGRDLIFHTYNCSSAWNSVWHEECTCIFINIFSE